MLMKERVNQFHEYFYSKKPYFLKEPVVDKSKLQRKSLGKRNSLIMSPEVLSSVTLKRKQKVKSTNDLPCQVETIIKMQIVLSFNYVILNRISNYKMIKRLRWKVCVKSLSQNLVTAVPPLTINIATQVILYNDCRLAKHLQRTRRIKKLNRQCLRDQLIISV